MKKTTKSLLVTALILFCAGVLLALCSALFVKIQKIDPFGIHQSTKSIEDKTVSLDELLSISESSNYRKKLSTRVFSKVDIRSYAGNVVVSSGEETSLDFSHANLNNLHYEIKNDTLVIEEMEPVGFFGVFIGDDGFSFKGLRQIFGPGNSANSGRTITLMIAHDLELDEVNVKGTIGNVTLEKIQAERVNVNSSYGKVSLNELRNPNGKITLDGNASSVSLYDCRYASCAVSTKLGNIWAKIAPSQAASTILDSWAGNITIETHLPFSYYKWNVSTMLGGVSKNDQSQGKSLREDSGVSDRITSTLFVGNIVLIDSGEEFLPVLEIDNDDVTTTAEEAESTQETQTTEHAS